MGRYLLPTENWLIALLLVIFIVLMAPASSQEEEELASSPQISEPSPVSLSGTTVQAPDSILKAIDAARPGDLLIVESGVYHGSINITKTISLIGRDTGSGPPVIDGDGNGSAVILSADGIYLEGFKIINSSRREVDAGLKLISNKNVLRDNVVAQNNGTGIQLSGSQDNRIINNTIMENGLHGISLDHNSSQNNISMNLIKGNNGSAIALWNSSDGNLLEGNDLSSNQLGISLWDGCDRNLILRNNASANAFSGIQIYKSAETTIAENTAASNNYSGIASVSSIIVFNATFLT